MACPVVMTMPFSPLSSDEEQQRMLGNSRRLYPGAEEEEEEEEEEMEEEEHDEDLEEENGELEVEEEDDDEEALRRGGLSRETHRPSAKAGGRAGGERPTKAGKAGHAANPYTSNPGNVHPPPANHMPQQQRRLKERSASSSPSEDAHISMMVFRIGIPDIKQTVSDVITHGSVQPRLRRRRPITRFVFFLLEIFIRCQRDGCSEKLQIRQEQVFVALDLLV